MNVIRATLNNKSFKRKRGRFRNAPVFFKVFPGTAVKQTSSKSVVSSSDFSSFQPLGIKQGKVLGTAERKSSSSHSTEPAFRTPNLTTFLQNRSATSDPQINNELIAECFKTPEIPATTTNSNSKISSHHKEVLRSLPPRSSTDSGRKPRSSTSSGARPQTTPSHSRTPRTPKTSTSLESAQNMVVAITEGRGLARGEIGLAAMDTCRPLLILCQISDSQTYINTLTKINVLHATEILVPNTFIESQQEKKLFSLLHDHFPHVSITTVQRRHFSDVSGLQYVRSLCLPECANIDLVVSQKFYALSAAAALLKYIEFQKNLIFMPKSLRIDYQSPENVMAIDMKTAQRLELVMSQNGRGVESSLLGILDHCSTIGGKRSLRANILQPPTDLDIIKSRLLSVTELSQSPALLHSLQSAVSKFCSVEQLLWLCVQVPNFKDEQKASELQTNYVLLLKTSLESLPVLRESLQSAQTPYFRKVLKDLDDEKFELMLNAILEVVNSDAKTQKGYAASQIQRCFAIKTGINGLLDFARLSYSNLVNKIYDNVNELAEEFGLCLRTCSTRNKGLHIQLNVNRNLKFSVKDLPAVFIQVSRTRNLITMTTEEIVVMNHRMKAILLEIQLVSNKIMYELLRSLRAHISCLYRLCENVSELDLIISFAQVSSAVGFVSPTFGSKMVLKDSRHPILDFISPTTPVANDVFASLEKNFHIITGPNMGGKSIYIKQVALLQVMAQIGCFVPAESAKLRITKQIFSRLGFDDSIEYNASSFVMEMQEMQYILRSLRPDCLVVIDELCRSTDHEEGTAIAWVLCEQLLQSKAFVFFTTHYLTLTKLQKLYPNVTNHQMVAEEGPQGRLVYKHKMASGVTRVVLYGLKLSQLSSLPPSVLQRAREICADLAKDTLTEEVQVEEKTEAEQDQEYIQELLNLIKNNRFNIDEVSKIQEILKVRYGVEDIGENTDFHEATIEEVDEGGETSTSSLDNFLVDNGEVLNNVERATTPIVTSKISQKYNPTADNFSSSKSFRHQDCTPRHSPEPEAQGQTLFHTPGSTTKMGTPGNLSQNYPNSCRSRHSKNDSDLMHGSRSCNMEEVSSRGNVSGTPKKHEFTSPFLFREPATRVTQNDNRLTGTPRASSIGRCSQSSPQMFSPHTPARTNNFMENLSINASQNSMHQVESPRLSPVMNHKPAGDFVMDNPFCQSNKTTNLFSNPALSPQNGLLRLVQYSPRISSQGSNMETDVDNRIRNVFDDFNPHHSLSVINSPILDTRRNSSNSSDENFRFVDSYRYCAQSLALEETNDGFQPDGFPECSRNLRQQLPCQRNRQGHNLSEDIFRSPRASPYARPSSTPGRLPSGLHRPSPSSSSSYNAQMVLSLYPSFDVVPRNLGSENANFNEEVDSFEE